MITLETERLILRPFEVHDAPVVQALAGVYEIAVTTLNIPYPDGVAETYIAGAREAMEHGNRFSFAITLKAGGELMGSMTLSPRPPHNTAEVGYWLGLPYWGQGYATEALRRVIKFGFEEKQLNRIYATVFIDNRASARVLEKAGMKHEGRLREHFFKWEKYLDTDYYGILSSDYDSGS
jgi:[ribosomal protein S5]-alanine N-acetyltransferase